MARLAEKQRKPIERLPSKALGLLDEPHKITISVGQTPWTVSSFIWFNLVVGDSKAMFLAEDQEGLIEEWLPSMADRRRSLSSLIEYQVPCNRGSPALSVCSKTSSGAPCCHWFLALHFPCFQLSGLQTSPLDGILSHVGIDLGLLSSWLRLLLLLAGLGKQDSWLDCVPEPFPQGRPFGYVEYHFRSRGHYCICQGGAGGLWNGLYPAGWPCRVLSLDRPYGDPSLSDLLLKTGSILRAPPAW